MFKVMQRMDDGAPPHTQGGARVCAPVTRQERGRTCPPRVFAARVTRPLTVLAAPRAQPAEALEAWAEAQEWIQTLFSSQRRLLPGVHFIFKTAAGGLYPRLAHERRRLEMAWRVFCAERLPGGLAETLLDAWRAAEDAEALARVDAAFHLPADESRRSMEGGRLLLERTRWAPHQGALGRYRALREAGAAPGHFIIVWAAVARFFQLGLGSYLTEYIRLEWDTARQSLACGGRALNLEEMAGLASALMRGRSAGLSLLEADEEAAVTAPPSSSAGESRGAPP